MMPFLGSKPSKPSKPSASSDIKEEEIKKTFYLEEIIER
jgi:hypothetical protein